MAATAGDSEGEGHVSVDAGARVETPVVAGRWGRRPKSAKPAARAGLHSLSPVRRGPPGRSWVVAGGATCCSGGRRERERIVGREERRSCSR